MVRKQPAWTLIALLCLPLPVLIPVAQAAESPADIVVTNARVYTVNARQPWVEAVAIRDGQILAAGTSKEIDAYRRPFEQGDRRRRELVLPGFTDCHVHFLDAAFSLERPQLDDAKDVAEFQRRVKAYADGHPHLSWVRARGWTYPAVGPTSLPDRKYLAKSSRSVRCIWSPMTATPGGPTRKRLNGRDYPADAQPPGGEIVRDPKTGEATGALKEDAATR